MQAADGAVMSFCLATLDRNTMHADMYCASFLWGGAAGVLVMVHHVVMVQTMFVQASKTEPLTYTANYLA